MLKEAIKEIREMAVRAMAIQTTTIDGYVYAKDEKEGLKKICLEDSKPVIPDCIAVSSLEGLVNWIKNEIFVPNETLFVEVTDYNTVICRTNRGLVREGETSTFFKTYANNNLFREGFRNYETAMIELRSKYQHTDDIDYLLGLLSSMTMENSVKSDDNGLTQQVTVKEGIALVKNETVRPIVKLKPYRTFYEVEQPESEFLVRINKDGDIGFFEADGGMWKMTARDIVKRYLCDALEEMINDNKVIVVL